MVSRRSHRRHVQYPRALERSASPWWDDAAIRWAAQRRLGYHHLKDSDTAETAT
jgi:hypothetical protein